MRKLGRHSVPFLIAAIAGLAAAWLIPSFGSGDVKASGDSDTYYLSDMEVSYPYDDPRSELPDEGHAMVTYRSTWSVDTYPGLVECQFTLKDASGTEVGSHIFDLSSATRTLPEQISSQPIRVSGPPSSVEGSCEGSSYQAGAGYNFGPVEMTVTSQVDPGQGTSQATVLSFPVDWAGEVHPAMRTCHVIVKFADGASSRLGPYNLHLSRTEPFEVSVPTGENQRVDDASVECGELRN